MNNKICQNDCFNRFISSKVWSTQNESMHFLHSVAEKFNLTKGKRWRVRIKWMRKSSLFLQITKVVFPKNQKKVTASATFKSVASRGKSEQNIQLTRQMFWNVKTSLLSQACIVRDCGKIEYHKNEACQKGRLLLQMWFDLQAFLLLCKSCPLVHNVK